MKAIVCEMCNSNDVVKQGEYYVCQNCGTKYETEAAKKLMVEVSSPVTVKGIAQAESIVENGVNTYMQGNYAEAYRLFSDALNIEPRHPKATLYRGLAAAYQSSMANTRYSEATAAASQALRNAKELYSADEFVSFCNDAFIQLTGITNAVYAMVEGYIGNLSSKLPAYSLSGAVIKEKTLQGERLNTFFKYFEVFGNYRDVESAIADVLDADTKYPEDFCLGCLTFLCAGLRKYQDTGITQNNLDGTKKILGILDKLKIDEAMPDAKAAEKKLVVGLLDKNGELGGDDSSWNQVKTWAEKYDIPRPKAGEHNAGPKASSSGGGCYVATAVYGSYDCPQVWTLRRFRDYDLAQTRRGRAFIKAYYAVSPTVVRLFGDSKWFNKMWRGPLDLLVKKCQTKRYADTPYEDKSW